MQNLDQLLLETIDEVLRQVFGRSAADIILKQLRRVDLGWEGRDGAEFFSHALHEILGSGAVPLEKMILRNLYSKLDLRWEQKNGYGFSDYVEELRRVEISYGRTRGTEAGEAVPGAP
jgi:hypothetical protein